ncbi:putative 21 protein [Hypsizygus marmoreus]|uniref:21 protein n=1 Tax=Hypsizygus marmoreus TaxID=39966 RepID=A0A369JN64_HYPMA|nr:putative 21 protein [Hypsizygus marmoreus]
MSEWKSPLEGYENAEPLPDTINPDGKSLYNPPTDAKSSAYDEFPQPIDSSNNGFDFHIYYMQNIKSELKFARELHERVRREFPELRIYKFWEKPVGPHPTAMFEVNTFTPHQTGALFSWLTVHRGPCSVLIHPNTKDPYKDHTELLTWMGKPWPLYTEMLKEHH